jgi:hypothetical protein
VTGPHHPAAAPDQHPGPRVRSADVAAGFAVVAVIALLATSIALGTSGGEGHPTGSMAAISPEGVLLDLDSVPGSVAVEYRHVADRADVYDHVRCWCGCEAAFDHRSLADCFVRADGQWEAHGAGCGICLAESAAGRALLAEGLTTAELATAIDDRFAPTTGAATSEDRP